MFKNCYFIFSCLIIHQFFSKIASEVKNEVPPQISEFKKQHSANLNAKFKLFCYLENGDPPVQYLWRHNGKEIVENSIKNGRISIERSGDEAVLMISKVQFEDSGNYSCQAKNRIGINVQSTILVVKGLTFSLFFDKFLKNCSCCQFRTKCGATVS